MPTTFIGCISCNTLLILTTDAENAKRAQAAGWQQCAGGWECPRHVAPPAGREPAGEPENPVTTASRP